MKGIDPETSASDRDSPPSTDGVRATAPGTPAAESATRQRLSIVRILVVLLIIVGTAVGGTQVALRALQPGANRGSLWFAPYVDATLLPYFNFQDPTVNPAKEVALAFVVGSPKVGCEPSWGASYSLDEASSQLDLDRRIARLRQRGGDVIVSFGGVANEELSTSCTDPDALADAYRAVITRYRLTTIDLDLEGANLDDPAAMSRRAAAIAQVQTEERGAGRNLDVWLTLPLAPNGLQPNALASIDDMLAAHVDLAGVNVMTMNYGASRAAETDFVTASLAGVDAASRQLTTSYARVGVTFTSSTVYTKMGVTPMIGQNDSPGDRLDTADAQRLFDAVRSRGVSRVSMWSLNRDSKCGGNIDPTIANNFCSGVDQTRLQFSEIFGAANSRPASAVAVSTTEPRGRGQVETNSAAGPYAEWRQRREYEPGKKVVWHGQVYEAKWWNTGAQPDAQVEQEWDSPWRLLGPVLENEPPPTTLAAGTYPEWSSKTTYSPGDRVLRQGIGYRAKWSTQANDPAVDVDNAWETPWEQVGAPRGGATSSTSTAPGPQAPPGTDTTPGTPTTATP